MIVIHDLSKSFGTQTVLKHVNLKIEDGSVFGLIGPNGSGKSTLLRIMTGIIRADGGYVSYDEKLVYENPEVKRDILLVSDDPYYFFHASIKDMKEFYKLFYPQLDEAAYHRYLDIFQLDEKKPMKNFSKGMKRQAFLSIALSIAPKYLLLDEAFDGLDPMMRLVFKRVIADLIEEKQITVVISSHNLREMEDICDSFGILEDYCINTSGNLAETKDNIHKIQLAFKEEVERQFFEKLDLLVYQPHSRVVNLVVKGDIDQITQYLSQKEPLMMEVLPVNLEEIFLYEMERKGYGLYE